MGKLSFTYDRAFDIDQAMRALPEKLQVNKQWLAARLANSLNSLDVRVITDTTGKLLFTCTVDKSKDNPTITFDIVDDKTSMGYVISAINTMQTMGVNTNLKTEATSTTHATFLTRTRTTTLVGSPSMLSITSALGGDTGQPQAILSKAQQALAYARQAYNVFEAARNRVELSRAFDPSYDIVGGATNTNKIYDFEKEEAQKAQDITTICGSYTLYLKLTKLLDEHHDELTPEEKESIEMNRRIVRRAYQRWAPDAGKNIQGEEAHWAQDPYVQMAQDYTKLTQLITEMRRTEDASPSEEQLVRFDQLFERINHSIATLQSTHRADRISISSDALAKELHEKSSYMKKLEVWRHPPTDHASTPTFR